MARTREEIKEIVENLGYDLLNEYMDKNFRRVIIQDKYGYKYDIILNNVLKGQGIKFVDKSNPYSLENISLWLKLNNSQFKLLENNEYKNAHLKLNFYCNKCEDRLKVSWDSVFQGQGCGVCIGKQVGEHHNLAVQRPDIAKEWHQTLNGDLTHYDVTYASNKKVWWRCPNGHDYFSRINDRTSSGSGCKFCSDNRQESKIATELKQWCKETFGINNVDPEHKMFKNLETGSWLRCDVYIGEKESIDGVYIEVHGGQHYKLSGWNILRGRKTNRGSEKEFEYQKHKDKLKRRFAIKHGTYIEIDLRKIKTTEAAISYIGKFINLNIREE